MQNSEYICQSCGMPLSADPNKGGTNSDKSISNKYCSFCYRDGRFVDEGITLQEKIDKNIQIAINHLGLPEEKARSIAENTIPFLDRWK